MAEFHLASSVQFSLSWPAGTSLLMSLTTQIVAGVSDKINDGSVPGKPCKWVHSTMFLELVNGMQPWLMLTGVHLWFSCCYMSTCPRKKRGKEHPFHKLHCFVEWAWFSLPAHHLSSISNLALLQLRARLLPQLLSYSPSSGLSSFVNSEKIPCVFFLVSQDHLTSACLPESLPINPRNSHPRPAQSAIHHRPSALYLSQPSSLHSPTIPLPKPHLSLC